MPNITVAGPSETEKSYSKYSSKFLLIIMAPNNVTKSVADSTFVSHHRLSEGCLLFEDRHH